MIKPDDLSNRMMLPETLDNREEQPAEACPPQRTCTNCGTPSSIEHGERQGGPPEDAQGWTCDACRAASGGDVA